MTTLVLICSPNMGIVDSWLPVLSASRDAHPNWRIVLVVPRAWHKELKPDDVALSEAGRVATDVLVEVLPGAYRRTDDFDAASRTVRALSGLAVRMERLDARIVGRLDRRLGRSRGRSGRSGPFARAIGPAVARSISGRLVDPGDLARGGPLLVCHDLDVSDKDESRGVLERFGDVPRFTISHGLGVPDAALHSVADGSMRSADPREAFAYAYATTHVQHYTRTHGLEPSRVRVTGVPRHDPQARSGIVLASRSRYPLEGDDAVLLISRPATSDRDAPGGGATDWLPAGRKVAQLEAIHRVVCEQHGLRLLVRPHPKERDDGTLQRGLPPDGEGRTWSITRAHPLHLAEHVRFAVAFSSGVAVDLLAAGVPTIEFQDVTGAPAYDRPDALRDARGRILRTSERRHGIVLPADDEEDLAAQVARILEDRTTVLEELGRAYRELYAGPTGAVASILVDLEQLAAGTGATGLTTSTEH